MLKNVSTEFKVGLFSLVALATIVYMFFVLSPDLFRSEDYKEYYTILDNAAGIVPKTHVKTNGVSIGKVKNIELEANRTKVTFEVSETVQVPTGSKVELRSVGLLGDVHIEVVRAEDNGEYLGEGSLIPQSTEALDMQSLISVVGGIAKDIKQVTSTLSNVFGTDDGEKSLKNILDNIEMVTADVRSTTTALRKAVGEREGDIQDMVTSLKYGLADLREFSKGLKEVVDVENRAKFDRILASFDEAMFDVKDSAKNIRHISDKIEKGEGTIGRLVNDDKMLSELEGAIKDIREVLAPASKLKVTVDYRGEVRQDESSQHYFNVRLATRPDRFYLIGITDKSEDVIETRTESRALPDEDGAQRSEQIERIDRKKALRFNLQFGKRWYFTTLRFGLFETTGGIAADFHLFDDKFKFSVEAFDWDSQSKAIRRTAHLKAYATVLFYNHITLLAGIDDPSRTDPETGKADKKLNYFFGAGLTFDDQDLKAMLGAASVAL